MDKTPVFNGKAPGKYAYFIDYLALDKIGGHFGQMDKIEKGIDLMSSI